VCVFNDCRITAEPCCALFVLSTRNDALYVRDVTLLRAVTPVDGDMYLETQTPQDITLCNIFDPLFDKEWRMGAFAWV
jgi:hypothetical protein